MISLRRVWRSTTLRALEPILREQVSGEMADELQGAVTNMQLAFADAVSEETEPADSTAAPAAAERRKRRARPRLRQVDDSAAECATELAPAAAAVESASLSRFCDTKTPRRQPSARTL